MKNLTAVIYTLIFCLTGLNFSRASEPDIKGSKDHPLLSRMPDFHISGYKDTEFDSYKFINQDKKFVIVEGHKYYIEYKLDKGAAEPGELKIRRNVQDALKKIGGKVLYDDNFNRVSTIMLQKENKETWVEVRSYNNLYRLSIVEKEIMKQEITADAEAMGNDINSTGHVSIYGIYFDTGKSEIKPESDAAVAEIAKMLKENASLNVYIVGHTDNVGSFDSNMKLSKERADAVVKTLLGKYGIPESRLKAYGVASLSPVMSNDTEEGRAKNRRVELVKQ
ncbi:MAG TPA: OmpA family protein [Ignavibacteriaceae bacterium]|nr:OmpA family protein [Ignavibacteriaceae bacterium]